MRLTKLTLLFLTIGLPICFLSCDDNKGDYYNDPTTIKVLSVEATTNFDLSSRSHWYFYADNLRYQFEVKDGKLVASPGKAGAAEFKVTVDNKYGEMFFTLVAEDYGKTRSESMAELLNIRDQQTPEKFLKCDLLHAKFTGQANEILTGLTFFHQNALFDFETENLPEGAKVYVIQKGNQKITPLRDANNTNAYKAIVFPENQFSQVGILIEANGKAYTRSLQEANTRQRETYPSGVGVSTIVNFTAEIDENDILVIKNLKTTAYSKEWPIDR